MSSKSKDIESSPISNKSLSISRPLSLPYTKLEFPFAAMTTLQLVYAKGDMVRIYEIP
jgi:hypothetical protein